MVRREIKSDQQNFFSFLTSDSHSFRISKLRHSALSFQHSKLVLITLFSLVTFHVFLVMGKLKSALFKPIKSQSLEDENEKDQLVRPEVKKNGDELEVRYCVLHFDVCFPIYFLTGN